MVGTIGYNPERMPKGYSNDDIDIRWVLSNLCILDFETPNKQMRIRSLHPGVTAEQVQESTSFELVIPDNIPVTADPTDEQIAILNELDPHNVRASAIPQ